jgi:hypothetical protein
VREPWSHVAPGGQAAHAPPKLPHPLVLVPVWQAPLASQHPDGQFSGPQPPVVLHARVPSLQLEAPVHTTHARPPPPHAKLVVPA